MQINSQKYGKESLQKRQIYLTYLRIDDFVVLVVVLVVNLQIPIAIITITML